MPTERFDRTITVPADAARAWDTVTDVEKLVSWIEILSDVREHAHLERYSAILSDRVGPFSLNADLEITVTDVQEPTAIALRAEGRDRAADSRIFIEGSLRIRPQDEGSEIGIEGHYEVTGRVATFGGPMIRSRADRIVSDFFTGLTGDLA